MRFFSEWTKRLLKQAFLKNDGEKKLFKYKAIYWSIACLISIVVTSGIIKERFKDTSFLGFTKFQNAEGKNQSENAGGSIDGSVSSAIGKKSKGKNNKKQSVPQREPIRLEARQVIARGSKSFDVSGAPPGTEMIGKLLTGIDTRQPGGIYKVMVTHSPKAKEIAPGTLFLGAISYQNRSKRVLVNLSRAVSPDGKESPLRASLIDIGDRKLGIRGRYSSRITGKVASALGLSLLTVGTDSLLKSSKTSDMDVLDKSLSNAALLSVSDTARKEAQIKAQGMQSASSFVRIPSGKRVIIQLNQTWRQ